MGKKRRDGRASKRGNHSSSSNAAARNSDRGGLRHTSTDPQGLQGRAGRGRIRYGHGTYEGEFRDGNPHGKGKMEWEDGEVYDGDWKDGTAHGWGINRWANGDEYEGEWEDGKQHGEGTFKYQTGEIYVGEMEKNERQGRGKMTWPSGNVYEGQLVEGKANGRGTMKYASGKVHEGEWAEGKEHGKGTMKLPSGEVCEGTWVHGKLANGDAMNQCPPGNVAGESSHPNADTQNDDTVPKGDDRASGNEHPAKEKRIYIEQQLRSQSSQQRRLEKSTPSKKVCEHCGLDDVRYKLRVCSGCNLTLYCSAACQKAASSSHRRICDIASMLPSRDSDRLVLEYDKEKMVDLDAGLRYATKYMANLKHLKIGVKASAGDPLKLSAKHLVSFLKSKKGQLDSLFWAGYIIRGGDIRGISSNGDKVWKELHGLKQLRLECMKFEEIQSLRDIVCQQKDSLKVLSLQLVDIGWSKAKNRRTIVQAVASCKQLVKLDLEHCSLTDSDLKVMLQDLPSLRILNLRRGRHDTAGGHGFTDNTCGLIARKCPALQDLNLRNHNQLTVRGIRKIFECCSHLRSFCTHARKLSCEDVQSLLEIAPQLMLLALEDETDPGQLDQIIEATGGRTVLWVGDGGHEPQGGVSSKAREKYDHQTDTLNRILRPFDPEVANYWDGLDDETR
ncbi:hypothetical protein ACHAXT_011358 [Thalassiosira profunda]